MTGIFEDRRMIACLVNGELSKYVHATSRGLAYGDGLFETLLVNGGRPRRWQAHMDRLGGGCERLGLVMPPQSILLREVQTVSAGLTDAVVKIVLARGGQARGYVPPADAACTRVVSSHHLPNDMGAQAESGLRARTCSLRLSIQPALGGIKHLNRLEQVLASAELRETGEDEGILLNQEDYVISAVSANIFLVAEDQLLTPRLDRCGVRGVVRQQILTAFGPRCQRRRITPDMLQEADEVFICNAVRGVVPLREIDGRPCAVGPVTRELQSWLQRWLNGR